MLEATRDAGAAHCRTCHRLGQDPRELSEGHLAAANWYHSRADKLALESTSNACLACHDGDRTLPREADGGIEPPRFVHQASHPFGFIPEKRRSQRGGYALAESFDPRLELVDGRIECTTCHDLFHDADDKLVRFERKYDLCLGCHVRNTGPDTGPDPFVVASP